MQVQPSMKHLHAIILYNIEVCTLQKRRKKKAAHRYNSFKQDINKIIKGGRYLWRNC